MTDIKKIFGNNLRHFREQKGLSQRDLKEKCGIGSGTISRMEQGQFNVTIETLERLAEALDTTPERLLTTHNYTKKLA